jgi:glycosyltransferase involved in cell wall biosynthesis
MSRGKKANEVENGLVISSLDNVTFHLFYSIKGGLGYFQNKKKIQKELLSYIIQSDVIIIRLPSTIGSFAADLCRKIQKPYIVEVVGCAWDSIWNYGTFLHKIYAILAYYQMKKNVKNSIAALYVTEFFLQNRYPMSGIQEFASDVQIKNTVDNVLGNHIDYFNRENDVYKIGMIGNLSVKYKGYNVAIQSLSMLKKEGVKFKFYLVGGGDQRFVRGLIKKFDLQQEVVLLGTMKAGDQIFQFLDELDLYIHPSKQEGLPRAVIEAMSRACPILASNVGGIPELLPNKFLHNPNDAKSLYLKMRELFQNKTLLIEMSRQNYIKSKEYQIDILQKKIETFYGCVKRKILEST